MRCLCWLCGMHVRCLLGSSVILTYTTSPIELTDGIERLLSRWGRCKIKVPVHEIAMMMTIALRFIPTLIEETDKIMNAQKARGADMETGSLTAAGQGADPDSDSAVCLRLSPGRTNWRWRWSAAATTAARTARG